MGCYASISLGNFESGGIGFGLLQFSAGNGRDISIGGALEFWEHGGCSDSGATENCPLYGLVVVHFISPRERLL